MKISVLSLFRDSSSYLGECLSRLETLEKSGHEFEFLFYENDSTDDTPQRLDEWISKRNGTVSHETLRVPKFGTIVNSERFKLMSYYRNKLLIQNSPIESDFCFLLDSDVIYESNIIDEYLKYFTKDVAMCTCNTVQYELTCVMYDNEFPSYYDSLALFDIQGNNGMTWSSNPFYRPEDIRLWNLGLPVVVSRAFGGAAMIRTEILNRVNWASSGELEHWSFCDSVRRFGKILAIPGITAKVVIDQKLVESIPKSHIENVMKAQKDRLNDFNNIKQ